MRLLLVIVVLSSGCAPAASRDELVSPTDASIALADSAAAAWNAEVRTATDLSPAELATGLAALDYSPAEVKAATASVLKAGNLDRLWKTKTHVYGYIGLRSAGPATPQAVENAFDIAPDQTLNGQSLRLTIDRLRVRKYPGKGTHDIAFFCSARTQVGNDVTPIEYSVGYSATEGDQVPAVGITMFEGIRVVGSYINLACGTTNVDTKKDKTFFLVLTDSVFTQGLKLLDTAQPALLPLTALTKGVRQELEGQHKGVPVQKWEIGLDLTSVSTRIKMREGSYLVIQIPPEDEPQWKWTDWEYSGGRIQKKATPAVLIPYNYMVIGASRM